jgi:hypothetical protein
MWHRDREDRIIESIVETDWMIQIEFSQKSFFYLEYNEYIYSITHNT